MKPTTSKPKTNTNKPTNTSAEQQNTFDFAFGPLNYILIVAGILLLGIGYILLSGGGSDDPTVFNAEMFNNRRLVAAPIIIVLGLVVEICAIMIRPKDKQNS